MVRWLNLSLVAVFVAGSIAYACSGPSESSPPVATVVAPAKQEGTAWQQRWKDVADAARREGKLMIYTDGGPEVRNALSRALKERFSIEVEYVSASGPEATRKILSERSAGLFIGDIYLSGASSSLNMLKPQGALDAFEPMLILSEVTDPRAWVFNQLPFIDKNGTAVALIATYTFYILVNTAQVKPDEITSFNDLLQPKWKGRMVMYDPAVPGPGGAVPAFMYLISGKETADNFMRQLARQEPVISRDRRQQIEWISQGKYPLAIGAHPETVAQFMEIGAPISPARTREGAMVITVGGGMHALNRGPHPNARTVFVNWVLSKEGATVFSRAFGHPSARKDVPPEKVNPIFIPKPDDKVVFETEEYYTLQPEMFTAMRQIFAPLMK